MCISFLLGGDKCSKCEMFTDKSDRKARLLKTKAISIIHIKLKIYIKLYIMYNNVYFLYMCM